VKYAIARVVLSPVEFKLAAHVPRLSTVTPSITDVLLIGKVYIFVSGSVTTSSDCLIKPFVSLQLNRRRADGLLRGALLALAQTLSPNTKVVFGVLVQLTPETSKVAIDSSVLGVGTG